MGEVRNHFWRGLNQHVVSKRRHWPPSKQASKQPSKQASQPTHQPTNPPTHQPKPNHPPTIHPTIRLLALTRMLCQTLPTLWRALGVKRAQCVGPALGAPTVDSLAGSIELTSSKYLKVILQAAVLMDATETKKRKTGPQQPQGNPEEPCETPEKPQEVLSGVGSVECASFRFHVSFSYACQRGACPQSPIEANSDQGLSGVVVTSYWVLLFFFFFFLGMVHAVGYCLLPAGVYQVKHVHLAAHVDQSARSLPSARLGSSSGARRREAAMSDPPGKWNETHLNQCLLFLTTLT